MSDDCAHLPPGWYSHEESFAEWLHAPEGEWHGDAHWWSANTDWSKRPYDSCRDSPEGGLIAHLKPRTLWRPLNPTTAEEKTKWPDFLEARLDEVWEQNCEELPNPQDGTLGGYIYDTIGMQQSIIAEYRRTEDEGLLRAIQLLSVPFKNDPDNFPAYRHDWPGELDD